MRYLPEIPKIYYDLAEVVEADPKPDVAVVAGRQLGVGMSEADLEDAPYGLSVSSRLNGAAGGMIADETGCELVVTGNDAVGLPDGEAELITDRYGGRLFPTLERGSRDTFESSLNLWPIFHDIFQEKGEQALDVLIVSDLIQSLRLVVMLRHQQRLYRKREKLPELVGSLSIAVAPAIVAASEHPDDAAWLAEYERDRANRRKEGVKQLGLLGFDWYGKLSHRMTGDRGRATEARHAA